MKTIKERKPFEDWNLEVTCTGGSWRQDGKVPCGSTLEMDKNDLVSREWFKYPNNSGTDYGFVCPVCSCFTNINDKELTGNIKNLAKKFEK